MHFRTLVRKHSSMEDLTDYRKASEEWDSDIKEGKLFPYEDRILMEHEKDEDEKPPGENTFLAFFMHCLVMPCMFNSCYSMTDVCMLLDVSTIFGCNIFTTFCFKISCDFFIMCLYLIHVIAIFCRILLLNGQSQCL